MQKTKPMEIKIEGVPGVRPEFIIGISHMAESQEERDLIRNAVYDYHAKIGKKLLKRALKEKKLTDKEWESMKNDGVKVHEIGNILLGHYANLETTQPILVATASQPLLTKYNKMLEKRFKGLTILSIKDTANFLREAVAEKDKLDKKEIKNYIG